MHASSSAKSIFLLVADLPEQARRDLLDKHCAGKPALLAEVESLLRHDPGRDALDHLHSHLEPARPNSTIGPYTIDALIAEGGSASVYAAHQDNPQRRVAVKILRRGTPADAWCRRFEREAEILAHLDHPGIPHFYSLGISPPPDARPYIAMELVDGEPIAEFAHRHHLSISARIELLIQACHAAEYGHRRGIIHRDLKPSNLLVSLDRPDIAASARVRLIDFGISRLLNTTNPATTTGMLMGTPAYMSPEQARADPDSIDARSDVYALGVILFELCTGRTPFGEREYLPIELIRLIADEEPTRLGVVNPTLRGDLEIITAKALARDVQRRYQTAAELADDLRRYLDKRPILARTPSARYILQSFVRRNRRLTAALVASLLFLATTVAISIRAALQGQAEARETTRKSAEEAEFWQGLMESIWRVPGSHAMRRQILGAAIPHLERQVRANPSDATINLALARAHTAASDVDMEQQHLGECRSQRQQAYSIIQRMCELYPGSVSAARELARASILLGDVDKQIGAEGPMFEHYLSALAVHERLAAEHPWEPGIADDLFWSYQRLADQYSWCGETAKANEMFTRQLATARANHDRWSDLPGVIYSLAFTLLVDADRQHLETDRNHPQIAEAMMLGHRLATEPNAAKDHISFFIILSARAAVYESRCGRSTQAQALLAECESLLKEQVPAGEEPALDNARAHYLTAEAVTAISRGDAEAARKALKASLPYARGIDAGASPGDRERRSMVEYLEGQVRALDGAAK